MREAGVCLVRAQKSSCVKSLFDPKPCKRNLTRSNVKHCELCCTKVPERSIKRPEAFRWSWPPRFASRLAHCGTSSGRATTLAPCPRDHAHNETCGVMIPVGGQTVAHSSTRSSHSRMRAWHSTFVALLVFSYILVFGAISFHACCRFQKEADYANSRKSSAL
jgi:hypothetical protein